MEEVKLYGFWYSPMVMRVIWTLKLKGIPYEYVEEDRFNKSCELLQYNPVYKKVPVLLHVGKPICESIITVEYIDEVWPHNPLLPTDLYEKAQARFWVKYVDDMMVPAIAALLRSKGGEERGKAIEDLWERFTVFENHQCLDEKNKFFGGDTINIVDIALGSLAKYIEVEEDMFQVKILKAERFPRLHSWFQKFKDIPLIKENIPNQEKFVAFVKSLREKLLASS